MVLPNEYFFSGLIQRPFPERRNLVNPSPSSIDDLRFRFQETVAFQAVKERVQRPWPYAVAMMFEFLHHCLTENRFVISVHQCVNTNETRKELPLM